MENKSRMQELIADAKVLRKCFRFVWKKRYTYIYYSIIGIILSLIVSFSIPKTYKSSVLLAPEIAESELGSSVANISSMVGVDLGGSQDAYTVDLYPKIVSSVLTIINLLEIEYGSTSMSK